MDPASVPNATNLYGVLAAVVVSVAWVVVEYRRRQSSNDLSNGNGKPLTAKDLELCIYQHEQTCHNAAALKEEFKELRTEFRSGLRLVGEDFRGVYDKVDTALGTMNTRLDRVLIEHAKE